MWKCFFLGDSGAALINYTILAAFSVNSGELLLFLFWPLVSRIFVARSRADMPIIQVLKMLFFNCVICKQDNKFMSDLLKSTPLKNFDIRFL